MNFNELEIQQELIDALNEQGITQPTKIQENVFEPITQGENCYILSATGTGKTLAYLLPLFKKIDLTNKKLQVIIITPTHELASQINSVITELKNKSKLPIKSQLILGGASTKRQIEKLKDKPQLIVGSIGRILELTYMKKLKPHTVQTIVFEEADQIIKEENEKDIIDLLKRCERESQKLFVSATISNTPKELIEELASDIKYIEADEKNVNISHFILRTLETDKSKELPKLVKTLLNEKESKGKIIVFSHKNETAKRIKNKLSDNNVNTVLLSSNLDKTERKNAISKFRKETDIVLVASDVSARGIDVDNITHIINYDIPTQIEGYLHRAGRTGRMNAVGEVISLVIPTQMQIVKKFTRKLDIEFKEIRVKYGNREIID